MAALCCPQAIVERSFSIAMTWDHRFESANAIAFPPTPANMSMTTVLDEDTRDSRSAATRLPGVSYVFFSYWMRSILCYGFRSNPKPCIISHVDSISFIVA